MDTTTAVIKPVTMTFAKIVATKLYLESSESIQALDLTGQQQNEVPKLLKQIRNRYYLR